MKKFLLSLLFLSCLIVVASSAETASPTASSAETVDTLIVGAGITGISSLRGLVSAGRPNAIILEADSRYGGRIDTFFVPGYPKPYERGASFFHDSNYNPLIAIGQQAGMTFEPMDFLSSMVWRDGIQLNDNQIGRIVNSYSEVWANSEPYIQTGRSIAETMSLGGYKFNNRGVETLLMTDEQVYGDNLELIDSNLVDAPPGDPGDQMIVTSPNGYKQILDYFLDSPTSIRSKLRLNSKVTKIDYSGNNGKVKVYYTQGNVQKTITANQIILTVSMGVLKSGAIQFVPPLPADKQNAINKIRFGNVNKGFIFFDSTVGQTLANRPVNLFYRLGERPNPRKNDQLTYFYNYKHIHGQAVIQSYYSGNFSREFETFNNRKSLQKHSDALGEFLTFCDDNIEDSEFTRWGLSEFHLGTYSTYGVGCTLQDVLNLNLSVNKKIYFAGEAVLIEDSSNPGTVTTSMGTTYAGYVSAQYAVQKIVNNQL